MTAHAMSPRRAIAWLLVALTMALFAAPQSPAYALSAQAGPTAQSLAEQAHGIAPSQQTVPRASVARDDGPDTAALGAAHHAVQPRHAAAILPAARGAAPRLAIRFLPAVRGPPAA